MRRFILTYKYDSELFDKKLVDIEGVQFTDGGIALEHHPYGGVAIFRSINRMEYELNEFGETSINWLDIEEEKENNATKYYKQSF